MTLLCVDDLRIAYPCLDGEPPAWAVDQVSFSLHAGERLGLVGESGSGKSTLGRAILRLLPPGSQVTGQITVAGKSVLDLTTEALRRFRGETVALIFQDPMTRLDPLMTIGDHCLETLRSHRSHLSRRQAKQRALETLEAVNIPASRWSQYPHEFSGGMRQRVAIALALILDPQMIIADEPTTSLDVTVSAQILQELTRLCADRQMGLLLISHDLAMVGEYCDRMAVMYNGKLVETGATSDILANPQHDYTRSLLNAALHLQAVPSPSLLAAPSSSPPLLRLDHLQQHYTLENNLLARLFKTGNQTIRAVDDISLALIPGETLGLVGESGCGKSTLSRTILQLIRPTAGTVEFQGQELTQLPRSALQPQRRQMQMIFQDPRACLNPTMTVGENIIDPLLIHRLASPQVARQQGMEMLERVGLIPAAEFYRRSPSQLSGGQQQRVAIARALITRPQLLICDEPVSMLDASVQTQVLELMRDLKREFHLTYLFITHDLWVARFFCDRIAVMQAGKIVELDKTEDLFSDPQHPYTQTLLGSAPLLSRYRCPL